MFELLWKAALKNRVFEHKIKIFINSLDNLISRINSKILNKDMELLFTPIFIIGAPRTGSTLLYQLMTQRFRLCFFSNLMMSFPRSTLCIATLSHHINSSLSKSSFSSKFGNTYGWDAPNQGWRFWTRFFQPDQNIDSLPFEQAREIRNTIAYLHHVYEVPFINKWQRLATKLIMINHLFPDAVFLVCKREPAATARSILQARRDMLGDDEKWFSTKPENYVKISNMNKIEQVCEQVYQIEEAINRQRNLIGYDHFFVIEYEKVVANPNAVLNSINSFYHERTGLRLQRRNSIPSSFRNSNLKWKNDSEYIELKSCANKFTA